MYKISSKPHRSPHSKFLTMEKMIPPFAFTKNRSKFYDSPLLVFSELFLKKRTIFGKKLDFASKVFFVIPQPPNASFKTPETEIYRAITFQSLWARRLEPFSTFFRKQVESATYDK